ncbi:hypothetical protein [Flammeovirga sp. EKP202]|uniref:hypothetical protein n=1 Tax=Flammeovirga sp. EKP202 TaxID=2770592 RepID=UPI00165FC1A8|nr:hypothetical protein [Flammeovirga sp. EKP202]MBD0404358.1 hypothetical protein [Flammeovirga sp. EKP202]
MKISISIIFLFLLSFNVKAQGLNIQTTLAEKEGKTTVELFNERKEERKTKKKEKSDLENHRSIKSDISRKEDQE